MAEPYDESTGRRSLPNMVGGLRDTWTGLPRERRLLLAGAAVVVVLVLVVFVILGGGGGSDWRPVARGLQPDDVATAQGRLDEKKIPYKLGDDGSVLVPSDKIHEARLELALSTMPSGKAVGFELFDENGMGRSSFTEKVNFHRALEGELARTIRHIDGVERARVHLVTPERRVFRSLDVEPSASVVLSLSPGASLTPKQAQAIRLLVAGAVERLAPGQVAIVDQHGTMLARPESGAAGVAGSAFEQQREQENDLERRVVELLEPVVGAGKVQARVALTMDFSQVVETREDFDPDQQVVRSEREQLERNAPAENAAAGAPGTATNLPGRQAPRGAAGAGAGREKSDTTKNYEMDKTTTRVERPLPRVSRMTVAVLVDEATSAEPVVGGAAPTKPTRIPRTNVEINNYTRLVAHAVGIDEARGDKIEVVSVPFAPTEGAELPGEEPGVGADGQPKSDLLPMLVAVGGGALVLGLLFAWLMLGRKKLPVGALPAVAEAPTQPTATATASAEAEAAARRARITLLRERALELGNEDIHRLTVLFERWFDDERRSEAEASKGRGETATKEAA